ncbi:transcription factor BHLH062-like isoform X2 [Tasmannia lanceolata]|uniref:transcription factor BHLH062-like isoform X2 n=1 Tax=Tasmannia lanceolata TaxID=3420 RepID=UPI0040641B24
MVPELPSTMTNEANVVAEKLESRSFPNKKNPGKAEREKLKRDHLNDLFLELGHALEPARQNRGKASILVDAARILQNLLAQVECLKKENVALLSESHYNELRDENIVLEGEIGKLKHELLERTQSAPAWSNNTDLSTSQMKHANLAPSLPEDLHALPSVDHVLHPQPMVGPVIVIPLHQELSSPALPNPSSHVSRPHARYPTPSDSWPLKLLHKQLLNTSEEVQLSSSRTNNSGEEGSGDVETSHGMLDNEE